ncbi:hypothetical protein GCK32_021655 [Trichostrongylus colubriformis]|uniref:Uncharacterized protein n=1 Tax=Trichostrongylus colubriformis TaxID=6319 RepID=A0AAN8ERT7_TRICO
MSHETHDLSDEEAVSYCQNKSPTSSPLLPPMVRVGDGSAEGRRGSPSEVFSQEINDAHRKGRKDSG